MSIKIKLKKGDEVIVLAGKDKGKTGKIVKMFPKQMKAIVSEINKVKKNQKPDNNQPGGIIDKEMPIHISNLSFFDSASNKGVRIGYKVVKEKSATDENFVLKDNKIAIQVGAFTDHRNAKSLIEKLSEFKAYIKREFVDDKYIYRVRIGPLSNINLANQLQDKLFQLGYTSSHLVMN